MQTLHHQVPAAEVPEWMRFTVTILLGLAVYTVVMFVQYLRAAILGPDRTSGVNGIVTIMGAVVVGCVLVWWLASAGLTRNMVFVEGGPALTDLDTGSRLLLALGIGAIAPAVAQVIKSRDNSDSATTPKIVAPTKRFDVDA